MISIHDIDKSDGKYDDSFLSKMGEIGISCPPLGKGLSFRVVGLNSKVPVSTIANAIRVGIVDECNVACLHVRDSDVITNSVYVIPQLFINYVIRQIPIRQVTNVKFSINVNNDTNGYRLVKSSDIIIDDGSKQYAGDEPMFNGGYHIARLPPNTYLTVNNIVSTNNVGYIGGSGHSYAIRVRYAEVQDNEYKLSLSPNTAVDPIHVIHNVCDTYIHQFTEFKDIVDMADNYEYADSQYKITKPFNNLVIYQWSAGSPCKGSMVEEFGSMLDPSHTTRITYNIIHNTINGIELKVCHPDAKKYMSAILSMMIDMFKDIRNSFNL